MRLYQTVSDGAVLRMAYDGLERVAEYDGSDVIQRRYVYGPGMDQPLVQYEGTGTSNRRFLSSDERGSIISVTDSSGALLGINRYDEYGSPQPGFTGTFGYTGQAWLPGINAWYYKARVYGPELGRFLQADPIGYWGGVNLYTYVGNDAVNWTDPLGLITCGPNQVAVFRPLPPGNEPGVVYASGRYFCQNIPGDGGGFEFTPSGPSGGRPNKEAEEICRKTIFRLGEKLKDNGKLVQFLGVTGMALSGAEWLFYRSLTRAPMPNPATRSFAAAGSIYATGGAMVAGGNLLQGLAGDRQSFKNAITDGTFSIMSSAAGANQVFGVVVDVGTDSFLAGAAIRCTK